MNSEKYFVLRMFDIMSPVVVESFDNKSDAESYAALMSRTKEADYVVAESIVTYEGKPKK